MVLLHPVQFVLTCLCIAWLVRCVGVKVSLVGTAMSVGALTLVLALGPIVLAWLSSGGLALLGFLALFAIAIVSHRIFVGQREKLFGKPQVDSSPKRRNEARRD